MYNLHDFVKYIDLKY